MFGSKEKHCQSCGMPLSKDANGGGTNADGSKSEEYCSFCYENGQFREPDITVEQMRAKAEEKMKSMGIPGFFGKMLSNNIPKLKRWKRA